MCCVYDGLEPHNRPLQDSCQGWRLWFIFVGLQYENVYRPLHRALLHCGSEAIFHSEGKNGNSSGHQISTVITQLHVM
jgi:hypothetical protein